MCGSLNEGVKICFLMPLKIGRAPKRKQSYSNHPFSGVNLLLVSGITVFMFIYCMFVYVLFYFLPCWELTYPLPAGTFESMIFLFPFGSICFRSLEG